MSRSKHVSLACVVTWSMALVGCGESTDVGPPSTSTTTTTTVAEPPAVVTVPAVPGTPNSDGDD